VSRHRLLIVGRTRYRLPLDPSLAAKFDALSAVLDVRVLASEPPGGAGGSDRRFRLFRGRLPGRAEGLAYYAELPFVVAREIRRFRPDALLVQGGHEAALALAGRALAGRSAKVVMDVHGDPGAATRLYGSPQRKAFAPLGDLHTRLALARVDGVRTISAYTTGLVRARGIEPAATFPAYMDLEPFVGRPPVAQPERPVVLFVGVLERYKAVDVLAAAWPSVVGRLPGAHLHLVGRGALGDVARSLVAAHPDTVTWDERLDTPAVAEALDAATTLVLPSRSEGLGRVVVEAFCRGRPVVASRVGGLPDIVTHEVSGLLVAAGDAGALADALVRVLSDSELAARLAAGAERAAPEWVVTPERYARDVAGLVERVVTR
jgi:glycosyltransferase involved in cell wall biosynthesis